MAGNFCSKCGAPLEQGAKFCSSCGARLSGGVSLEKTVQVQPAVSQSDNMAHRNQEFDTMSNNVAGQFHNSAHGGGPQQAGGNSFIQSFKANYFTAQGRLNRWAYFVKTIKSFLMALIPAILLGISLDMMQSGSDDAILLGLILVLPSVLLTLLFSVASLLVGARRCHDLGHSGWLILLTMVPYINVAFDLYILFCPGTRGDNQYGPDPLQVNVY